MSRRAKCDITTFVVFARFTSFNLYPITIFTSFPDVFIAKKSREESKITGSLCSKHLLDLLTLGSFRSGIDSRLQGVLCNINRFVNRFLDLSEPQRWRRHLHHFGWP